MTIAIGIEYCESSINEYIIPISIIDLIKIILKSDYNTYRNALELTSLTTLSERRSKLCLNFAKKCLKNPEMKQMFPLNPNTEALDTRFREKFKVDNSRTDRHKNSAIPYMQRLLNKYVDK